MRLRSQYYVILVAALSLSIFLNAERLVNAEPQEGGLLSKGFGAVTGAVSGAINGGLNGAQAGAESAGNGSSMSASASAGSQTAGGSANAGASSAVSTGGSSGGASASGSLSIGGGGGIQASASLSLGTTTAKPEGLLGKLKEVFKEGKEMVKNSIDNVVNDDKSKSGPQGASASSSASMSSGGGGLSASASINTGGTTPKPEGIIDKISDMSRKTKDAFSQKKEEIKEKFEEKKDDIKNKFLETKEDMKEKFLESKEEMKQKFEEKKEEKEKGPLDKLTDVVSKGTEMVKDTVHKFEDKANEVGEKVQKSLDDNIFKPIQSTSGSGHPESEGKLAAHAEAISHIKGPEREKYLMELKRKQEAEVPRAGSLKEIVAEAKSKGVLPKHEDRSVIRGNHADEKSVAVEVFDKYHEISKIPVETILKPIDKILGYEKDPLLRFYDNSHEILRQPLGMMAKPVESVLTGAFKTSDEAKKENDRLLATKSDQERKEAKIKEEKSKKEDRSIVGDISDKTVELLEKPFEIVLKPLDHALGFDKKGKKNPFLRTLDEIYGLSKKPVDAIAKPLESILKKMAGGEQAYEVSVRVNGKESSDPKLFTRLADGALNVANRVMTKPFEVVMKPLNHALGFDEPGKKNPIVEAAHQLKNATRVGVELFTRPIDRIIKEIAEIGEIQDEAEREAQYQRKKEEASRLVRALDKLHEIIQTPFEIVLRPVTRALGMNKDGKKEPLLRAWDVMHQVVRTPIQVISKPWEDAILGEQPKKPGKSKAKATVQIGSSKKEAKKNIIVDGIKKVEKIVVKPVEVITSPIRKLILGEDDEKVGTETDKNNREIQAKSKSSKIGNHSKQPDKIMRTIESMNNVLLKPLEVMTQPISDLFDKKQKNGGKNEESSKSDKKEGGAKLEVKASAQASQHDSQKSQISASAQIKKN